MKTTTLLGEMADSRHGAQKVQGEPRASYSTKRKGVLKEKSHSLILRSIFPPFKTTPKREEPFLSEQRNTTTLLSVGIYQEWARTDDQVCQMQRDIIGVKRNQGSF